MVDPGYSTGTPPWGMPVPGAPSCTYRTPVDGVFHELSITSAAGSGEVCLQVHVLYRGPTEAGAPPAHLGPSATTCLSGSEVIWPAKKLEESKECFRHFFLRLKSLLQVAHVGPGDPGRTVVEPPPGPRGGALGAELEKLESAEPEKDGILAREVRKDLIAPVQWARMPGSLLHTPAAT